ncbi:hypothetical protein Tco_1027182, partial [Tanacetum coccineum]
MHSLNMKELSIKLLLLEHLNRTTLLKDETILLLMLLERCYQLLNFLYYDNSGPDPQLQNVSPSADTTGPSQQELDLLFGPLYDEFFNAVISRVNTSSSPTDNSAQQDILPSTNIHPTKEPSTPTHVNAEENNNDLAEFTNPFCTPVQEVAESSSYNI